MLPEESLDVFVGTWNMNEQHIPSDLSAFLQSDRYPCQLYVVGTQVRGDVM